MSADVFLYSDIISSMAFLSNPKYFIFSSIAQCCVVSYALLRSIKIACIGLLYLLLSDMISYKALIFNDVSISFLNPVCSGVNNLCFSIILNNLLFIIVVYILYGT